MFTSQISPAGGPPAGRAELRAFLIGPLEYRSLGVGCAAAMAVAFLEAGHWRLLVAGDVVLANPFSMPIFCPPFFVGYAWRKKAKEKGTHVAASPLSFSSSGGSLCYSSHR